MGLNVKERAHTVATYRWIEVRLMEMLAAWVPTTPEMEVKLVFGAHIWDVAQHADAFGRRATELRLPLNHSVEPASGYVEVLEELAESTATDRRVAAIYDILLPGLERRFADYIAEVDTLLDEPTIRILERCTNDIRRMTADCEELRQEVSAARLDDDKWAQTWRDREARLDGITSDPESLPIEPSSA